MSWGAEAGSAAGSAGSGAASAGGAAAGSAGSASSAIGGSGGGWSAASNGVNAAPIEGAGSSGFNAGTNAMNYTGQGTTDSVGMTPSQIADQSQYGHANPTMMDKMENGLDRFKKGGDNSVFQAYDKFGNNPETYGYAVSKLRSMGGGGGGGNAPANLTTNVSYQQPENSYLRKRGRY